MGNDQDLNLTIRAKDEASDTINKVNKAVGQVSGTMTAAGKSSESMAKSVFKGTAAYDLMKKAVGAATAFLADSVRESMEASRVMAQVETNVKNAGLSFDQLAPKIKAYGDAAVQLGFDDETAAEGLSKLLLVTKDFGQAQALMNLSMDLARNKNIDLADATRAITLVTQGNTKALKEYGIELGAGATTADILNEAQKKLKNSAVDFSKTAAGQAAILAQEYSNIKQEIGDGITPALLEMMQEFKKYMPEIQSLVKGTVTVINALAKSVFYVVDAMEEWGSVLGSGLTKEELAANDAIEAGNAQLNAMVVAYNKLHPTAKIHEADLENNKDLLRDAAHAYNTLNKSVGDTGNALSDVKNKADSAGDAIEKMKKIAEGKQNIADEIVDQEKKIKDITEQIRAKSVEQQTPLGPDATYADSVAKGELTQEIFKLQQDLAKEKAALESVKNNPNLNISKEIAEANRRSALTDFQRRIEDIGTESGIKSVLPSSTPAGGTGGITFVFNGPVAGDSGIKQIIVDTVNTINRQTALKTGAGV